MTIFPYPPLCVTAPLYAAASLAHLGKDSVGRRCSLLTSGFVGGKGYQPGASDKLVRAIASGFSGQELHQQFEAGGHACETLFGMQPAVRFDSDEAVRSGEE